MATQPRTDVNDIRIREMAALANAPTIVHTLLDVLIIRVMGTYGSDATFTPRFIQGCLRISNLETELEYIEKHIARLLELKVIWQPEYPHKCYQLTNDMVNLILQLQRR